MEYAIGSLPPAAGVTCFESLLSILSANKIPQQGPLSGYTKQVSSIIQSEVEEDTSCHASIKRHTRSIVTITPYIPGTNEAPVSPGEVETFWAK